MLLRLGDGNEKSNNSQYLSREENMYLTSGSWASNYFPLPTRAPCLEQHLPLPPSLPCKSLTHCTTTRAGVCLLRSLEKKEKHSEAYVIHMSLPKTLKPLLFQTSTGSRSPGESVISSSFSPADCSSSAFQRRVYLRSTLRRFNREWFHLTFSSTHGCKDAIDWFGDGRDLILIFEPREALFTRTTECPVWSPISYGITVGGFCFENIFA